ncbi:MAG: tail fiber domain-containing protein [Bacteroidetes bacterium]|nr:tail fiber domain-containing protein [Bacteroidota bacterium]
MKTNINSKSQIVNYKWLCKLLTAAFLLGLGIWGLGLGSCLAQGVAINADGTNAADCSMLDVSGSTMGMLIPRVSLTDVTVYAPLTGTAVTSLLVYSNTAPTGGSGVGYYYWDASGKWVRLGSGNGSMVTGSGTATQVAFWNSASALSGDNGLYWDNTNIRLGIGTTSPGGYLDINPTYTGATVTNVFNQKSGFTLNNGAATVTNWYGLYIVAPTVTAGTLTNRYALVTEANAGNVGIGTTSPTYKLHVIGKIKTDDIDETSDERLKKNIVTIDNALTKVETIRGVYFNWRSDEYKDRNFDTTKQIGVIAQEIEKIIPEVVSTDADGYKSVEYSKLVGLLIEAIKELKIENTTLKDENNARKADIENLKIEIRAKNEQQNIIGASSKISK